MADPIRVLCVDDESFVREATRRALEPAFSVVSAANGKEAIVLARSDRSFAVIVTDLRMPGVDGITLLTRLHELIPDAVPVLVTGEADLTSAVAAVNDARVFRFLMKPARPQTLRSAVVAAAEHYRLVTGERVLLEQTLRGSMAVLADILGLMQPAAFGRVTRLRTLARAVAERVAPRDIWQIEVAALFTQLALVAVDPALVDKVYAGDVLNPGEQAQLLRASALPDRILSSIPRLDDVREILRHRLAAFEPRSFGVGVIPIGARVLRAILDLDQLESEGNARELALDILEGRHGVYDPQVLRALREATGVAAAAAEIREMRLVDVREGMVFAADVFNERGLLLVARGQEVTPSVMERIRNFWWTYAGGARVRMLLSGTMRAGTDNESSAHSIDAIG